MSEQGEKINMQTTSKESNITWHRITDESLHLPDASSPVLIYDEDLDDVTLGCLEWDEDDTVYWQDVATDQRLPNPTWWADVPFPEDV
jgi:hypothetical protein